MSKILHAVAVIPLLVIGWYALFESFDIMIGLWYNWTYGDAWKRAVIESRFNRLSFQSLYDVIMAIVFWSAARCIAFDMPMKHFMGTLAVSAVIGLGVYYLWLVLVPHY